MAHQGNVIRVEETWFSSRLVWPSADMIPVQLDPWWRARRDIDLYHSDVGARIDGITGINAVVQGLESLAKGRPSAILPIVGDSIADWMPWEALERSFIDRSIDYHPIRVDRTIIATPADRPGPLRLALVIGHEGKDPAFERDQEIALLRSALSASAQINARVVDAHELASLDLAVTSDVDRRKFFAATDPHVVLYFGHGTAGKHPSILVGRDQWLPLERLAADAVNDNPFPISWVFIACSIGEAHSQDIGPAGPQAFRILAKRGARAMLAMRARIRPTLGRIVAMSLIESLSAGIPLEQAAASARKAARRAREAGTSSLLDWAAPAVWSTAVGPMPPRGVEVPSQLIAQKLNRLAADDPGIGLGPPAPEVTETAQRWLAARRVRVDLADADEPSTAALLAKICGAMTSLSPRTTLFVRVKGSAPFVTRLAEWADNVQRTLDHSERETAIGRAVRRLAERDLDGLESLLGIPGIAMICSSAPGAGDHAAWAAIEGASGNATVVLGYLSLHQQRRPGWILDRIDTMGAMQITAATLAKYPRTLALLSALNGPAKLDSIALLADEPSAQIATTGVIIEMPGGVVLAPGVRGEVRGKLPVTEFEWAHRRVFEARQSIPALIESDDVFAPVHDLVGARAPELAEFVEALATRSGGTWTEAEWLRLGRALEPARDRWRSLAPELLLEVAHALVGRQSLKQAEPWLEEIETDDLVVTVRRLALQSEVAKAEGTPQARDRMWRDARSALRHAEGALAMDPANAQVRALERDMRANLARLELYFDHDATTAKKVLETVLGELDREDEAAVARSLVSTLRNLAECLFEFIPFRNSRECLAEARDHLLRAEGIARRYDLDAMGAEVVYSAAKLDATVNDWSAARDHLTDAIARARDAGHAVCQRIAEMRLFWLAVHHEGLLYDHALFSARLRKLEFLESHAWARRYAAQARLWAARELEMGGDREGMKALLTRTLAAFEPLDKVSSDADRRFVSLCHAGLASSGDAESWMRFKLLNWSAHWIETNAIEDASSYWREGK